MFLLYEMSNVATNMCVANYRRPAWTKKDSSENRRQLPCENYLSAKLPVVSIEFVVKNTSTSLEPFISLPARAAHMFLGTITDPIMMISESNSNENHHTCC